MFYCLTKKSGAVLFLVIILTIALSVVVIGIMSINVSQVKSSQTVIDDLKAEYLAQGYFYQRHQQRATSGVVPLPDPLDETSDGKTFTITLTNGVGIAGTEAVNVNLNF